MPMPRNSDQVQTVFGGHVAEQHAPETARHLPPSEGRTVGQATKALTAALIAEVVKAVRTALSRRGPVA